MHTAISRKVTPAKYSTICTFSKDGKKFPSHASPLCWGRLWQGELTDSCLKKWWLLVAGIKPNKETAIRGCVISKVCGPMIFRSQTHYQSAKASFPGYTYGGGLACPWALLMSRAVSIFEMIAVASSTNPTKDVVPRQVFTSCWQVLSVLSILGIRKNITMDQVVEDIVK